MNDCGNYKSIIFRIDFIFFNHNYIFSNVFYINSFVFYIYLMNLVIIY